MAPMVHGLEVKYHGRIQFTFLDADDAKTQSFQSQLGFYYQPHFFLIDGNGNVLTQWLGFTPEEKFDEIFAQYLQ